MYPDLKISTSYLKQKLGKVLTNKTTCGWK